MKTLLLCLLATIAHAQVVPTTPTKFGKRNLGSSTTSTSSVTGGSSTASVGVPAQKIETTVRTITYLSLTGTRQWTSIDGKPLLAKLIAFEDMVVESLKSDATAPAMPKLSGKPTVVKDGKVRLLSAKTPYEVALDKLSPADRDFIQTVQRGAEATPAPTK